MDHARFVQPVITVLVMELKYLLSMKLRCLSLAHPLLLYALVVFYLLKTVLLAISAPLVITEMVQALVPLVFLVTTVSTVRRFSVH